LGIYGIVFFVLLNYGDEIILHILGKKLYNYIYTLLEYSFFTLILGANIPNKRFRRLILISSVLFILFQLAHYLSHAQRRIDSIPIGIETILVFIYIFLFFYDHFTNVKNRYIYNNYCFWVSIGLLIYLGGSFFFNLLANQLDPQYWFVTYITEILKNVLFVVAIIVFVKNPIVADLKNKTNIPNLDMI
jgi:hypothetical protein